MVSSYKKEDTMLRDKYGRFIKGNEGFWKGKKRSKDTNDKIKKTLIGKFLGEKHPNWRGGRYNRYEFIKN